MRGSQKWVSHSCTVRFLGVERRPQSRVLAVGTKMDFLEEIQVAAAGRDAAGVGRYFVEKGSAVR